MTAGRTRIKICGLSRMEDIGYANEALPDYCGFVIGVPSSRRNVTVEQLISLKERLSDRICPVGVFVNAEQELVAELLNGGVIDIAQLHGREDEIYIRRLRDLTDKPLIKAFRYKIFLTLRRRKRAVRIWCSWITGKAAPGHLLNGNFSGIEKKTVHSGRRAGCRNIPEAVSEYHPYAVDLSSSVETGGKKDREKILAAVAAVRSITI